MNTSFYQKYRPKKFDEIIGQDYIVKTLINSIKLNRIGHVYVFGGPKGIGKTTIAKIFSKAINCENFHDDICNECPSCQMINNGQTTDILELDAASNSGVESIRTILENSKFLPAQLKYKVYIIDEAHMLSNSAWNAFLKTLEEPPMNVVFIFATTEVYKIPATILSRCQCFEFSRLNAKQIENLLTEVAKAENIKISSQAIKTIVNLSDGSARDSLSILEQVSLFTNNNVTDSSLYELFGLLNTEEKIKFISLIFENNIEEIIKKINEYEEKGINFSRLILDIGNILLDVLIYEQTKNDKLLSTLNITNVNSLRVKSDKLIDLINLSQKNFNEVKKTEDVKFAFQIFIFSMIDIINQIVKHVESETSSHVQIVKTRPVKTEIKKNNFEDIESFNLTADDVCCTEEIKINDKKEAKTVKQQKVELKQKESASPINFDIHKIGAQIIANSNSDCKKLAKKIIEHLNELSETSQDFMCFSSHCKVVTASKNGIIVYFDDDLDTELLNKNFSNPEIQKGIIKIASQPMYIIAGNKTEILSMKKDALTSSDVEIKQEPSLNPLRQKLKDVNELGTIAFEVFGFIDNDEEIK